MDNEEIIRRYDNQFQQRRSNFDPFADEISRYIAPIRAGQFYQSQSTEAEIRFTEPEVFDSTARKSAGILKASIQGAMLPPGMQWFDLLYRNDELNDDKEAKEWIETCANRMFLQMQDSKFQLSAEESIAEMVDFGNTVVFEEEHTEDGVYKGIYFDSVPIREIYFDEKWDDSMEVFYRRFQWTPIQIMSKFAEDDVPDSIKEKASNPSDSQARLDVIFCVFPRNNIDPDKVNPPVAPEKRPFGYKYVLKETVESVGKEGGYYEFPAYLARWGKTSGSKWGWGPGHIALPDVQTANRMVKNEFAYVEKVIDPPSLVSERNVFGSLDLTAGGVTVVQDIDGIRPYVSGANYGEAKMSLAELRERIEDHYYVNELQMKDSPQMTATETIERKEQILKMFGPMRSRVETELFDPVLQRTFNIMYRNGQFPDPPAIVAELGGQIDVKYTGPMARAQRAEQVSGNERWLMGIANLAQIFPEAMDIPDVDAIMINNADLLNVPAKNRKSQKEIDATRKARAEQQKAMQEAAMAQEAGAGMEAMGKGQQAMEGAQ
jgi:hypothetical protein